MHHLWNRFSNGRASSNKKIQETKMSFHDGKQEAEMLLRGPSIEESNLMSIRKIKEKIAEANGTLQEEICLIQESPKRIFQCATKGYLQEFQQLYNADPNRLSQRDAKKRTALHLAAKNGHINIIDFIIKNGGDMDAVDCCGETPLHSAVLAGQDNSVDTLLSAGADSTIKNKNSHPPLHLAVEKNQLTIVKTMVKHASVDVNLGGHRGSTPLHYCAYKDRDQCAVVLLENGALVCQPDDMGVMPVHAAGRFSATNTLNMLLTFAKNKYGHLNTLSLEDNSSNNVLHAAITGGDHRTVRVCIMAGSSISSQCSDGQTAVHKVADHGCPLMMGIMVEFRNEEFKATLHITDVLGMTPLHRAAMFNRFQLIKVMLNHGADIDAKDDEGRSPCLLAASRKSWTSTNTLLEAGADSNIMDKNSRNLLHIVIRNNGNPEHINLDLCKFEAKHLLEDKDDTGCTPLHYASKLGLIATTQGLMHKGAKGNIKNKNREAPLHFAAKYGRYNTCQFLLETSTGLRTLNDMDSRGNSPLHLASQQGHTKVVQLLLSKGANIFRDENGNTPLHHAAENGYSQTMHAILSIHPHLKDANNNNLDTPLHLASRMGHAPAVTLLMTVGTQITKNNEGMTFLDLATIEEHKDVCVALITHDRWTEALHTQSDIFNCPIEGFIKHLPDVCKMVLDKCKTSSHKNFNVKEFHYTYDFTLLQVPLTTRHKLMAQDKEVPPPLHALNSMVKFNRTNLLAHPVCVAFLAMKWRAYGVWVHLTNLLTYFVFLAALTTFIGTFDFQTDIHYSNITFLSFKQMGWQSGDIELITLSNAQQGMVIIVSIFCLLNLLKELVQMIQQRRKYFLDLNNALEWVLYLSSGIFIGPFLARISCKLQWQFGTIAVFLAWFNLLLFLQRFDFYGIYVVMFLEILRTLLQALFVFSILLIAFGFSFYIILCREETKAYHTPVISLMSSLLMMTGNIEYMDIWVDPAHDEESRETRPFNVLAFIMLAVFIILMPILVMNLLIGLAVGDIEAIQKNAKLKRMAMQVELHTDLEQKLPKKLLEYVDKSEWDVYPNSTHYLCHKIWSRFHHTRSMSYPDSAEGYGESDESIDAYLYTEMYTHKKKLKQMSANLDKTYDLLRLVVQKMEIKTEADETDEAETPDPDVISYHDHSVNSWAKPALRQTLIQQASVIAQWKSIDK